MTTWKVARLGKTCARSGRPLPPDAPIVAALFGVAEEVSDDKVRGTGLERKDFLIEGATEDELKKAVEGAYCVWRTKTPSANPAQQHRLDLGLARELLERLRAEGDPTRAPVLWTLAMLLIRKRQLQLVAERGEELELRWPKEETTFRVANVVVPEAEQEGLQQELGRLFAF
ncbi:MAG: hypothetical protein IT460_00885 [Planctomycetes bacterium]|nr:hypothetical protein [Planctomycetota bacterium]